MNIAFISIMAGAPWGGSEELWSRTALCLKKNGHKVLAGIYSWSNEPPQISQLRLAGIDLLAFERPVSTPKRFYKRFAAKSLRKDSASVYMLKLKRFEDFKADLLVISQGGTFNISANEQLSNFLLSTTIPYVVICHHNNENGGSLQNATAAFEMQLLTKAKKVYFVAERNLATAERQLAAKISNAEIVSNPVNITSPGIKPFPWADNKLLMACVARLDIANKGQDLLLEALSADLWKQRNFELRLYGAGPDAEYLERLTAFFSLNEKVKIMGYQPDVENIWLQNQVLILPSINEGTPLSLVEAMLCGRPALVTDVGDNSKFIIEGETGFLATGPSVKGISATLESLWSNRKRLDKLGENAWEHVTQTWVSRPEQKFANALINVAAEARN